MPTTIKLKNSVTTTNAPTSLVQGEVAINITDKKVWVGDAATTPIQLLGAGASASFSALSCTTLSASGVATFSAGTVSAPAITTTGDTNTGIFFPAADTIAFTEGGVESMRIDSSGNVGIGTNSPSARLNVSTSAGGVSAIFTDATYSTLKISHADTSGLLALLNGANQNYAVFGATTTLYSGSTLTERMRIDSSGNVGIGTSTPVAQLGVFGAGQTTAAMTTSSSLGGTLYVRDSGNSVGNGGAVIFGASQGAFAAIKGLIDNGGGNTVGHLAFSTRNATGDSTLTERMRITFGGAVCIGGTTVDQTFNVVGKRSWFAADSTQYAIKLAYNTSTSGFWLGSPEANALAFSNDAGTERMRITSGGNVGIGTTNPGVKFVVSGTGQVASFTSSGNDANCELMIQASNNANRDPSLYLECPGLFGGGMFLSRANTQLRVYAGANTTGVSLANGGNSWGSYSDERLKDIIEPITNAAEKISSLRAVIGRFKTDDENKRRSFLIAQDVQKVLPEAVYANSEEDDTLNLAYTDTIPLLVAAIKELNAKVEAQAAEIALLKSK
jgi:hypothetical protein